MIEGLFHSLESLIEFLKLLLEFLSVLCVILGLISIIPLFTKYLHHKQSIFLKVRIRFGSWLVLALELQLGADILATTISPTFEDLGKLAILTVVRTFLNYFLMQELEHEKKQQKENR
jgi:uncharacterized membrane protein